jgi:nucleotide-binding universal stress UspA family protein
MFKKILVPLDGTRQAEVILPYISQLAKGFHIPVMVMTVVDPHALDASRSPNASKTSGKSAVPVHPELRARKYLEQITQRLAAAGTQVEMESAVGQPAEQILRVAESHGCHLIAILPHTEDRAGRGILGSVTTKLLYHSHIPILLASAQKAVMYAERGVIASHILVALDGSRVSETALPYAQDMAQKFSLNMLLVRAINERPLAYVADPSLGMTMAYVLEDEPTEAMKYLEHAAEELRREGLEARSELLKGSAAQGIVDLAARTPESLIVMTSHGQSALARWLMGSVTEEVVRTTENPILVIPRQYGRRYALEVTELLGRTPIFSGLTQSDLERISQMARVRIHQPGDVIVREGDRTGGFFIVTSGKVAVTKGMDSSRSTVLAELGPGEFFGEIAVLSDQPRSATVQAVEPTECVTIRRSDFLAELERHPEIAVRMLPELVRRFAGRSSEDPPTH